MAMPAPQHSGLAGKRVLVSGARGFLGSHLCLMLVGAGAKVAAISRTVSDAAPPGVQWWQCELADFAQAEDLVREVRPEVIFHLGGRVSAAPDLELVLPTFYSLLASTVNLLTLAARHECGRVLLVGSLEEPEGAVADDLTPASPYAAAKWAGGAYGRMFHQLYGCSVVNVRPFMTYGPGQAPDKIIPSTISALLRGEAPRVSSGRRSLDWVYVDDVIDGILRAATACGIEGTSIDLGTGIGVPVREVVERLVRLVDPSMRPEFGARPDRPGGRTRIANLDRAHALLGWRPTTTLEDGLAKTVAWHRARLPLRRLR
jgi:UDP-glucose 4-epimerase